MEEWSRGHTWRSEPPLFRCISIREPIIATLLFLAVFSHPHRQEADRGPRTTYYDCTSSGSSTLRIIYPRFVACFPIALGCGWPATVAIFNTLVVVEVVHGWRCWMTFKYARSSNRVRCRVSKWRWRRGLVWGVWWLGPTGTGLFVEISLDLRGLIYGPLGVPRP